MNNDEIVQLKSYDDRTGQETGNVLPITNSEAVKVKNNKKLTEILTELDNRIDQTNASLDNIVRKIKYIYNVKSFKCDDGEYVKGDGIHDDTTGIQKALNESNGVLIFPPGIYRVTKQNDNNYCLRLNKNLCLKGETTRNVVILGDTTDLETDILQIAITNNFGNLDCRNWEIKNLTMYFVNNTGTSIGGKNALHIMGGGNILNLISCKLSNLELVRGKNKDNGYGLKITNNLAHSIIEKCTIDECYLEIFDANLITKNMFSGWKCAITLNCIEGVYNNTIRDNTITNGSGALNIINGDAIRFQNNQCEHATHFGISKHEKKTMIYAKGVNRKISNLIIEDNNFGGGTNLDYLIYLENTYRCVISKNQLIPVNRAEIRLDDSLSDSTIIKQDNTTRHQVSNPRPNTFIKYNVENTGKRSYGVKKNPDQYMNNWTGGSMIKSENGLVSFWGQLNGGNTTPGTKVMVLPVGFRPIDGTKLLCSTSEGLGILNYTGSGVVTIGNIPSNAGVQIYPFYCRDNE